MASATCRIAFSCPTFSSCPSNGKARESLSSHCSCKRNSQPGIRLAEDCDGRGWRWREQKAKSWKEIRCQGENFASSSSSALATDSSSSSSETSADSAEVGERAESQSGMSVEERDAILEFEKASSDDPVDVEEEEKDEEMQVEVSKGGLQLTSEQKEEIRLAKAREYETKIKRSNMYAIRKKSIKGRGKVVADIIDMYICLLDRPMSNATGMLFAAAGSAVLQRVEEEVAKLQDVEGVEGQLLFEILRVVKLLRMDLKLLSAARKESTLIARLEQTRVHCRQVFKLATIV